MDEISSLQLFVSTVKLGGFTNTARVHGLSVATVSRRIAMLEEEFGAQLLVRSNRGISLTDAGQVFLTSAEHVVETLEEVREKITGTDKPPRGILRVQAQTILGSRVIVPAMRAFRDMYPDLKVILHLTDESAKLVEDGIDVSVKAGSLPNSSLHARKIADMPKFKLCASSDYITRYGMPAHPDDLANHDCLDYRYQEGRTHWRLTGAKDSFDHDLSGSFSSNSMEALRVAAVQGMGIGLIPLLLVRRYLAEGRLVEILKDYTATYAEHDAGVYVIWSDTRYMSRKVRIFIDFLASQLSSIGDAAGL